MVGFLVMVGIGYFSQLLVIMCILIDMPRKFGTRREFYLNLIPLYFFKYFFLELKDGFNCLEKDK
jgi:hypothetical protein